MIPKVNGRGHSFKGVALYLTNDTPDQEPGTERVLWSETENILTDNIMTAAKVMAWTDLHADDLKLASGQSKAGAKPTAGAVYHYSLSWAKSETPDQEHMKASARETIAELGLSEHEYFMVAHGDKDHSHVHIIANLTHPETGKRAELGRDYVTLQKWALGYEREHGMHCQVREDNAQGRAIGKKIKHQDQKRDYGTAVTRAFHLSDNGASFVAALENEGLQLAKSRRGSGFVVVDEYGDIQKLGRQLDIAERDSAKTAAINQKLADVDLSTVPDGEELATQIKADRGRAFQEESETARQNKLLDAADRHAAALAKAAIAEERRAEALAARLQVVEKRHAQERAQLEQKLSDTSGAALDRVKAQADELARIVNGRGFGLSLRRFWRGQKDRENLDQLRQEVTRATSSMDRARADLGKIHDREKSEIRTANKTQTRFSDLPPAKRISYLERLQEQAKAALIQRTGQDRVAIHLADKNQVRIRHQKWQVGESERQKEAARTAEIDGLAQRVVAERRQAELYPDRARRQDVEKPADKKPDYAPQSDLQEKAAERPAQADKPQDRPSPANDQERRRSDLLEAAQAIQEREPAAPVRDNIPQQEPEPTSNRDSLLEAARNIQESTPSQGFER